MSGHQRSDSRALNSIGGIPVADPLQSEGDENENENGHGDPTISPSSADTPEPNARESAQELAVVTDNTQQSTPSVKEEDPLRLASG